MIIDSHAHLKHGDAGHTEYSAEQIVATMDAAGIDRAVVFGICTTPERAIEMARAAAERFPKRLIPYAYGLPNYTGDVLRMVARAVREYGFKGIKVHAGECTAVGLRERSDFRAGRRTGRALPGGLLRELRGDGAAGGPVPEDAVYRGAPRVVPGDGRAGD